MQAKKLSFQVSMGNQNLFGKDTMITVRPASQRGWHWEYDASKAPVPISANLLSFKKRRLVLRHKKASLNIYEHIGALRWTGLDSIVISSDSWPPYDGRSWELYRSLEIGAKKTNQQIQWCTLDQEISAEYKGSRSGFTKIIPNNLQSLKIIIVCGYEGLGKDEFIFNFPARDELFEEIFKALAPGWPPRLFYLQKFFSLLGWPHLQKSLWMNHNQDKKWVLRQFALHRATDLLGALSLIHPERLLSGIVISNCSGHWADAEVVKKSQFHIRLID